MTQKFPRPSVAIQTAAGAEKHTQGSVFHGLVRRARRIVICCRAKYVRLGAQGCNHSKRHNLRGLIMHGWSTTLALVLLLPIGALSLGAQEAKRIGPTGTIGGGSGPTLSRKQTELVRRVNGYFNQLTNVKGTFLQTSADNKRQRGKFYISRPGRFRFEFNLPSRVVIISDGKYVAIQDRDLNTDDRWDLSYTPFRALLQNDVDLLRDVRILEVQEIDNTIVVAFEDKSGETSSRIKLFLTAGPPVQIKAWIAKDAQGLDTRVDLTEVLRIDEPDAKLFNPAAP
jgi:outer membrane lipoprotein-sorting protein